MSLLQCALELRDALEQRALTDMSRPCGFWRDIVIVGQERGAGACPLGRRQRLGDLAVVAIDGHCFQAHLPGVDVQLLDFFDRGLLGRFTVLEMAPEMNGCAAAIIFTWPR